MDSYLQHFRSPEHFRTPSSFVVFSSYIDVTFDRVLEAVCESIYTEDILNKYIGGE